MTGATLLTRSRAIGLGGAVRAQGGVQRPTQGRVEGPWSAPPATGGARLVTLGHRGAVCRQHQHHAGAAGGTVRCLGQEGLRGRNLGTFWKRVLWKRMRQWLNQQVSGLVRRCFGGTRPLWEVTLGELVRQGRADKRAGWRPRRRSPLSRIAPQSPAAGCGLVSRHRVPPGLRPLGRTRQGHREINGLRQTVAAIGLGDQDRLMLQSLGGRGGQQTGVRGTRLGREGLVGAQLWRVLQVLRSTDAGPTLHAGAGAGLPGLRPRCPLIRGLDHLGGLGLCGDLKRRSRGGQKDVAPKIRQLVLGPESRRWALALHGALGPGRGPFLGCWKRRLRGQPPGAQRPRAGFRRRGEGRCVARRLQEEGLQVVGRLLQVAGGGGGRRSGQSVLLRVGAGPPHFTHHVGTICLDWLYSDQVGFHWLKRTICTRLKGSCRFRGARGRGLGQAAAVALAHRGPICLASDRRGIDLLKKPPWRLIFRFPDLLLNEGAPRVQGPGHPWRTPVALAAVAGGHAVRPHRTRHSIQGLEVWAAASSVAPSTEPRAGRPGRGPVPELITQGGRVQARGLTGRNLLVLNKLQVLHILILRAARALSPRTRCVAP